MKCPICGVITKDSRVLDSRQVGNTIKRRRECEVCKGRWNTFEVLEDEYVTERNKHRYIGWTSGETHTLVKLYQQDLSKTEIARLLGRSRMSVSRKLDKLMASGEYFEILNVVS